MSESGQVCLLKEQKSHRRSHGCWPSGRGDEEHCTSNPSVHDFLTSNNDLYGADE